MTPKQKALIQAIGRNYRHLPNMGTKGKALLAFKARVEKKKLPKPTEHKKEKSDYKKMTIDEYEAKYGI